MEEDYSADVQTLDGYGDWDYNSTYGSYVWRPQVAAGWSPYSYGSWYYTPIGLSWWSSDPWGWYPYHYGNWFFDVGWNNWCWSPGYVYSPAWCYYGYTSNYFGWCPTGYYGGYSPWWDNYYKNIGWGRDNMAFAVNGRFNTRQVDMRGWNFTGVNNLGTRGRLDVVPGTRVVDRLGGNISVSSRPIVLSERGGNTRDALRNFVREAPRVIERTSNPQDSERLAPFLARERQLPDATVQALRERTVVAQRGRLVGPGASEMTARSGGGAVVERGRVPLQSESRRPESFDRSPGSRAERGRVAERPARPEASSPSAGRPSERPNDTWRGQPQARSFETRPQVERSDRQVERSGSEWRGRPAPAPSDRGSTSRPQPTDRGSIFARSPRIEEGARGGDPGPTFRPRSGSSRARYRDGVRWSGIRETAGSAAATTGRRPRPRDGGRQYSAPRDSAPRDYAPRGNSSPDRGRSYSPPSGSAPREAAPRSYDRGPAPRSAPAPQAAPPRSAPAPAPRSAPPPSSGGHRGRP